MAYICVLVMVSSWQCVEKYVAQINERASQCIGDGGVPPSCVSQTLGRVMHRKAHRLALTKAYIVYMLLFFGWQNVEKRAT